MKKRIILASILALLVLVVAPILYFSNRPSGNTPPDIIIGVKVKVLNSSEIQSPALTKAETAFLKDFDFPVAAISLDYVYLPSAVIERGLDRLCIEKIYIQGHDEKSVGFFQKEQILFDGQGTAFCLSESNQYYLGVEFVGYQQLSFNKTFLDNRYYPFDSRRTDFNIFVSGYGEENNTRVVFPEWTVSLDMVSAEWSEDLDVLPTSTSYSVSMILKRPIIYRILFWVLPAIVLISITGLFLVESRGSILEVSMGMLSLWSIQEILVPEYVHGAALVIWLLTGLYVLLGISLVYSLIKRRKRAGAAEVARATADRKEEGKLAAGANLVKAQPDGDSSIGEPVDTTSKSPNGTKKAARKMPGSRKSKSSSPSR